MVARRAAPAFRPSAPVATGRTPSRVQASILLIVVIVLALIISVVSYLVKPNRAHAFNLFYGSVFINDNTEPVAVDLATGKPTVRLNNAFRNVSATSSNDLDLIPLAGDNTLMLDHLTGAFNMIDSTGFVVKPTPHGVQLPHHPGTDITSAIAAGDSAYLVQRSTTHSWVYLVNQLTVAEAQARRGPAKARAYATMANPIADVSAPTATADADLWALTDAAPATTVPPQRQVHALTQLSLPAGSNLGANLRLDPHGTVTGVAALDSATTNVDGSGGSSIALASSNSIRVFGQDGLVSLPISVDGTVTDILAASNARGRFWFLYETTQGWTVVTAPANGVGSPTVRPLASVSSGARLIAPAVSDGHLYTMDTSGSGLGDLLQLDADGTTHPIPGAPTYPYVANVETLNLGQSQVIARGSRVIFNARANDEAEVVFSDGSSPPRTINKRSGVEVDPTGETTLASGKIKSQKPGKSSGKTKGQQRKPTPTQPVKPKIDCKTTHQIPHIPQVTVQSTGARSVTLVWQYPILGPQDCRPSTYTVSTRPESSNAPTPPDIKKVYAQNGLTLTGLFPDTDYLITVTAYLTEKNHTAAPPVHVHTTVEGPAAPTAVHTTVDRFGNWHITWHSCGGVQAGCVPVANWNIIPRYCDGQGLSNAPDTVTEVGDPTLHLWQYVYRGNDSLLGRGMSFTVQGVGTRGTPGDTASDQSCSYSWTNPVAKAITVEASQPPQTATSETTTTTTVSVHFADGATHDLGGVGGKLSYELMSGSEIVSRVGPTTSAAVKLAGVTAGRQYQVVVTAIPPNHPEAAVQLPPVNVEPTFANWPDPTVAVSFANTNANKGTLTVVPSLGGAVTKGETFDLTPNSFLQCSNAVFPIDSSHYPKSTSISPDHAIVFRDVDRFSYYGDCTVSLQLAQNASTATDPPLYGAGASKVVTASVSIAPPSSTATANDFTAKLVSGQTTAGQSQIVVDYKHQRDPVALTTNWTLTAQNAFNTCGSSTSAPNPTTTITVNNPTCLVGGSTSVQLSYTYFGATENFTVPVKGSAPQPVDSSQMKFSATWNQDPNNPALIINYSGPYSQSTLDRLNWTYTLTSNSKSCLYPQQTTAPRASGTGPTLQVNYNTCPPTSPGSGGSSPPPGSPTPTPTPVANTYTLTIHYDDPYYSSSYTYNNVTINGTPPQ